MYHDETRKSRWESKKSIAMFVYQRVNQKKEMGIINPFS